MTCAEYRRRLLAEPNVDADDLREHRAACPACSAFSADLARFESRLNAALRIDLPQREASANIVELRPRRASASSRRWFAMAASLIIAAGAVATLWLSSAQSSLASAVVKHMGGEPDAWTSASHPVSASKLYSVLKDAHMTLKPDLAAVTYAQSCSFRGHQVPHLVVQSGAGPATVMVLVHENVAKPEEFSEHGYRGMIVPVRDHGSLAIIMRGAARDPVALARIAGNVAAAVQWTP